jgi:hypothetical protein
MDMEDGVDGRRWKPQLTLRPLSNKGTDPGYKLMDTLAVGQGKKNGTKARINFSLFSFFIFRRFNQNTFQLFFS